MQGHACPYLRKTGQLHSRQNSPPPRWTILTIRVLSNLGMMNFITWRRMALYSGIAILEEIG